MDDAVCLRCGAELPENKTRCPSCGWSYVTQENGAFASARHVMGSAHAGPAHEVSGQDFSNADDKPLRISLLRVLKEPFFWLYLTLGLLVAFLLLSAGLNWLLKARG